MKRITSLILTALLLFSMAIPASAAVKDEAQLLYDNINAVSADLSISSLGIATCFGSVTAKDLYTVLVEVRLQMKEDGAWHTVKTFSSTGTMDAACTGYYAVYSGYQYRVYVTGYVYNSSGTIIESASCTYAVNYY